MVRTGNILPILKRYFRNYKKYFFYVWDGIRKSHVIIVMDPNETRWDMSTKRPKYVFVFPHSIVTAARSITI